MCAPETVNPAAKPTTTIWQKSCFEKMRRKSVILMLICRPSVFEQGVKKSKTAPYLNL